MRSRRLCTECNEIAHPVTVLDGSDRLELLCWLLFAVPGFLYCWWRQAAPTTACLHCGGEALIREARSIARRGAVESPLSPRIRSRRGSIDWPRALATPRERMVHGGVGGVLGLTALSVAGLVKLGAASSLGTPEIFVLLAVSWSLWLAYEISRLIGTRETGPGCRAWDGEGRPLHIEAV